MLVLDLFELHGEVGAVCEWTKKTHEEVITTFLGLEATIVADSPVETVPRSLVPVRGKLGCHGSFCHLWSLATQHWAVQDNVGAGSGRPHARCGGGLL